MKRRPIILEAYRGYGASGRAVMSGRVYREPPRGPLFLRRFARRGLAGVDIAATLAGAEVRARSDADGYFSLRWDGLDPSLAGWQSVRLGTPGRETAAVRPAEVHIRGAASRYVVVSDIDDTALVTDVAHKPRMYWRMYFRGPEHRSTFAGAPEFYRALRDGCSGTDDNPVLFVSRGPWWLYDHIERFFIDSGIADRPLLLLREWGASLFSPLPRRPRDHKRATISALLEMYGEADIVLIGDTGQHDPEVYAEIAHTLGRRLRAVYLREIGTNPARRDSVAALFAGLPAPVVTADTNYMYRHAVESGLIAAPAGKEANG